MMTHTNTRGDLVVSCAHALGGASWCWLVVGIQSFSMVLCCRLRHPSRPSVSCTVYVPYNSIHGMCPDAHRPRRY
jgi:hypothetical protein